MQALRHTMAADKSLNQEGFDAGLPITACQDAPKRQQPSHFGAKP